MGSLGYAAGAAGQGHGTADARPAALPAGLGPPLLSDSSKDGTSRGPGRPDPADEAGRPGRWKPLSMLVCRASPPSQARPWTTSVGTVSLQGLPLASPGTVRVWGFGETETEPACLGDPGIPWNTPCSQPNSPLCPGDTPRWERVCPQTLCPQPPPGGYPAQATKQMPPQTPCHGEACDLTWASGRDPPCSCQQVPVPRALTWSRPKAPAMAAGLAARLPCG